MEKTLNKKKKIKEVPKILGAVKVKSQFFKKNKKFN